MVFDLQKRVNVGNGRWKHNCWINSDVVNIKPSWLIIWLHRWCFIFCWLLVRLEMHLISQLFLVNFENIHFRFGWKPSYCHHPKYNFYINTICNRTICNIKFLINFVFGEKYNQDRFSWDGNVTPILYYHPEVIIRCLTGVWYGWQWWHSYCGK